MGKKNKAAAPKTAAPTKEVKKLSHANIYAALSAFQGELKPMEKNAKVKFPTKKGGEIEFSYTTLDEIMKTIYPMLMKHGLSIRHEVTEKGVEAILVHETYKVVEVKKTTKRNFSGTEEELEEVDVREENIIRSGVVKITFGSDMTDIGSAITYARRYTLNMVLGIASDDDKDASLQKESGKNAQSFVHTKAKQSINDAKTIVELEKQMKMIDSDMKKLNEGKAPTLGLTIEDYLELQELAAVRLKELKEDGPTIQQ